MKERAPKKEKDETEGEKRLCAQCRKPLSMYNKSDRCHSHSVLSSTLLDERQKFGRLPTADPGQDSTYGRRTPPKSNKS